jgi:hypothetical protein
MKRKKLEVQLSEELNSKLENRTDELGLTKSELTRSALVEKLGV